MLPDFLSIAADLRLGERLLLEAVERYGLGAYLGALCYVTDVSADAMREAFLETPDGVYEGEDMIDCDGIDDSEEYLIRVQVTIAGGRARGRPLRQLAPGAHVHQRRRLRRDDGRSAVALKFLLEPTTPFTSGVLPPRRHRDPAGIDRVRTAARRRDHALLRGLERRS